MDFFLGDVFLFKVNDIRKNSDVSKTRSANRVGGSENFADYLSGIADKKETQVQATSNITSVDAIFLAQAVDGEEEKLIKRKLINKGKTLLDKLEEIRDGLLLGEISKDRLIEISRLVKQKNAETTDEKLKEIIDEIELRVEVELAKLTR